MAGKKSSYEEKMSGSQLIVPIIVSIIRVLAVSGRMTAPLNSFYGYRIVFKGENNEKTEQS